MTENEKEFSFKDYLVPLTSFKAIHFIVIIGLIVFFNMLFNNFVWDDINYLLYNDQEHTINLIQLFGKNLFNVGSQYRPIPALYFAFLYRIFHDSSFFYHITQLFIHIFNTIILFFIFKSFFSKKISFVLSIIFLVHPIQVESVSYISSADNLLFFLFGIVSLYLNQKKIISNKRAIIIFALLLLSFLTKETGFLFLIIIFLYRILFIKGKITEIKNLSFYLFGLVTVVVYCLIRFAMAGVYFAGNALPPPIERLPLMDRLVNIPVVIFYYIKTFFIPIHLIIDQQWTVQANRINLFFPITIDTIFFLIVTFMGIYAYKKTQFFKTYLFFLVWFLIGLGMHAQIFPLDMTVADRWFYFPIVGLLGMIGVSITIFSKIINNHQLKLLSIGFTILVLTFFSIRTVIRNNNWKDGITLYTHDLALADNNDIENNLGDEYLRVNNYNEAIKHFKTSVSEYPTITNVYNLALAYEKKGDYKLAEKYYIQALNLKTNSAVPSNFISITHEKIGYLMLFTDSNESINRYIKGALKQYPTSGPLWADLTVNEYRMKHYQNALNAAEKAKNYEPSDVTFKLYQQMISKTKIAN